MPAEGEKNPLRRVERFLDRLFETGEGLAASPLRSLGAEGGGPEGRRPSAGEPEDPAAMRARRFLLTVDDAGEFLVSAGDEHVLGHRRGDRADLPVLADVGIAHARFVARESLAAGREWRVEPFGSEEVLSNGEPVSTSAPVAHGDLLRFGANLELRFEAPDPASSTAVLHLLHGAECLGAAHVLLLGEGLGGRLRIGAAAGRHIRVPNLLAGMELVLSGERLLIRSDDGVAEPGGERRTSLGLEFPLVRRTDLLVGTGAEGRPPFGLSFQPLTPRGEPLRRGDA